MDYERKTNKHGYVGLMASDSHQRESIYLRFGCNVFGKNSRSRPIAFWTSNDIWEYIKKYNINYSKIYKMGEHNTGCIFCMFGLNFEKKPNRFERMKKIHPKLYDYCMNTLELKKVIDYLSKGSE